MKFGNSAISYGHNGFAKSHIRKEANELKPTLPKANGESSQMNAPKYEIDLQ